jgi:Ca-activated chloride channel family protein
MLKINFFDLKILAMTKKNIITVSIVTLFLCIIYAFSFSNAHVVSGSVYDENGEPLIGASVLVKETNIGAITDINGSFSIDVPEGKNTLIISYTGFTTQEIIIEKENKLIVNLKQGAVLESVVVTGYSQKKENRSNKSISVIKRHAPTENSTKYQFSMNQSREVPMVAKDALTGASPGIMIRGKATFSEEEKEDGYYDGIAIRDSAFPHDDINTEMYGKIIENPFQTPLDKPLSTFGIDVDRASYSNMRRMINSGYQPVPDAIRIEEMINYFDYQYPQPKGVHPFAVNTELATCPWNPDHYIMKVGLQGKEIKNENLPPSNLVFLIDVSGSMSSQNKLGWVKESFKVLLNQLRDEDLISIVVYAGAAGTVLPPTKGTDRNKIIEALDKLKSGGSTAGGAGIKLAYKLARENFKVKGNNRVILATDGDFNVGVSSKDGLVTLIEKERESGVFLTVLGFGTGNYQDHKMQELANRGNGNHAYIDNLEEAKKVLSKEFGGTMHTIAKDVKIQVQFNTDLVDAYRLIGYENRMLRAQDFNDDTKDAGEIGAGHKVTAMYEIIPKGNQSQFSYKGKGSDEIIEKTELIKLESGDLAMVKLRYKKPNGKKSIYLDTYLKEEAVAFEAATENLRFAASVAEFGLILRDSEFKQKSNLENVILHAAKASTNDPQGYRKEFISLVKKMKDLTKVLVTK